MSQMPSKIWLHKDTKHSTGDIVCGYQYDFVQGIDDEGGIENFVKYVPADAFIEKAVKYLNSKLYDWVQIDHPNPSVSHNTILKQDFIVDFKNYLKL